MGADSWEQVTNPAAAAAARAARAFDLDLEEQPPLPELGSGRSISADRGDDDRHPIPEGRGKPRPTKKGGTAGLWILLLLLLLAGAGGGAYYYQDKVVELYPPADNWLTDAGLRHEKPGAGLELRNAGTPERMVVNETDILIVRGVIANVSDRARMVPPMKLMLLDHDKHVVQEKIDQPPVTSLDVGGTASFRIQLQRPDPSAVEVNVIFIDPTEAQSK